MLALLARLNPFKTADAKRLAVMFGVVYFAQGMWYLPNQAITIVLKDRGLSAGQAADFFLIALIPWIIKPVYGLLSDFVPLFGRRRQSYFLLTSALAGVAGLALAWGDWIVGGQITPFTLPLPELRVTVPWTEIGGKPLEFVLGGPLTFTLVEGVWLFTLMGLGLAFTDVLTDALMVENGRPRGLTGAFQSVQWACITLASVLVGELGGNLAETRSLRAALLLAALAAVAGVVGAAIYAPLSRRMPLKHIINLSIAAGVLGTLAYLLYRDKTSALIIDISWGAIGMITQLAFLDLAAKACPRHVEATFFAALMSVYNIGQQLSQNVGARLYDAVGYTPLVYISAAMTALAWVLVPLVRIDRIEAKARADAAALPESTTS